MANNGEKAVVIFSGGMDSTTTLYYALSKGFTVDAITFEYGQKHNIEIEHAKKIISRNSNIRHLIVPLDTNLFKGSSLVGNGIVPKNRSNISEHIIPSTYVPARNLIFLSIVAAYAESNNIQKIFIGINSQDYSGYPDCRNDFIDSFETTVNLATRSGREGRLMHIEAPLANLNKKDIILLANKLNVPLEITWSCYDPVYQEEGRAVPCMQCDSCILRQNGFREAGLIDPAIDKS